MQRPQNATPMGLVENVIIVLPQKCNPYGVGWLFPHPLTNQRNQPTASKALGGGDNIIISSFMHLIVCI